MTTFVQFKTGEDMPVLIGLDNIVSVSVHYKDRTKTLICVGDEAESEWPINRPYAEVISFLSTLDTVQRAIVSIYTMPDLPMKYIGDDGS